MINLEIPIIKMFIKELKPLPNDGFTISYGYSFVILDDSVEHIPLEMNINSVSPNQNRHSTTIAFSGDKKVAC